MKKHLFLHLSFIGLMGLSTIAYGDSVWTKYGPEFKSGDPIPNGDCLEMMCPYGCVEDENGLNGTCCPNEGTNGSACTIGACCQSGVCNNGKCGCPNGGTAYTKPDSTIGCCNSSTSQVYTEEGNTGQFCCTNTCVSGGTVPSGTIFDKKTMVRKRDCSCECLAPLNWTNQNLCCAPIERLDGTFDCKTFSHSNAYDLHNPNARRPYDKIEFSGTYKYDHSICLTIRGVDDDIIVNVGNTQYGPFWNTCAGLASDKTNGHKLSKKYFVPARQLFELKIRDICKTNVGINYSIDFCDE